MSDESDTQLEWLNSNFLKKAIQSYKNDETIEILKFEINLLSCENFASRMYSSKITFKSIKSENEVLSVVIKVKPINYPQVEVIVNDGPLFETEIEIYEKVLPAMQKLYEKNGIKLDLAPELIYITSEPTSVIILRDLTPDGYAVFKNPPEHIDDSKMIIKRLAQFHAASIYFAETNEIDMTKYDYTIFKSENIVDIFLRDSSSTFREVVAEWDGFDDYLPKIDYLIENVGEIGRKCYTPNQKGCGFNVLNHGDFHLRNILFTADSEQRVEKFYFIDYQLNVWASPAIDINYFLGNMFGNSESDEIADVIAYYHQELVHALTTIGFKGEEPSLTDINAELSKLGCLKMILWINFFSFLFVDWNKVSVADFTGDDIEKKKKIRFDLFNTPALKQLLQKNMKEWHLKGYW